MISNLATVLELVDISYNTGFSKNRSLYSIFLLTLLHVYSQVIPIIDRIYVAYIPINPHKSLKYQVFTHDAMWKISILPAIKSQWYHVGL